MDKECRKEIHKVLKKFHFSTERTVEGALEDIEECLQEYQQRKIRDRIQRREIEAQLRAEENNP